jgi:preprotein translocase subunit SecG
MSVTLVLQILVSVLIVVAVLLQSQQGGLSKEWGGVGSYHAKRGLEKVLFYATIVLGVIFALLALLDAIY